MSSIRILHGLAALCLLALFLTPRIHAQPAPPASIAVTPSDAAGQVTFTWSAVPGATGYTVRRAADPLAAAVVLSANQPATTFTDTTGSSGVTAYYSVTAVSAAGESAPVALQAAPVLILDNGASGTSSTGTWTNSTAAAAFGPDSRLAASTTAASPSATYTYSQSLPVRGAYDVYLRWNDAANRSASVPVWVYFDSDSIDNSNPAAAWSSTSKGAAVLEAVVDQSQTAGPWVRVGSALCNGLLSCTVVLRNNTGVAGQNIVADAVQFVPRTVNAAAFTVPVLSDEFSAASLDTAKWSIWDGRSRVTQSGGELVLSLFHKGTLRTDGSGYLDETEFDDNGTRNWISGGIHAPNHSQAYGYYEIRFRATQETGVDNAFWMLTEGGGSYDSMELDVPEVWTRLGTNLTTHGAGLGSWRTRQPDLGPGPDVRYWTSGKGHKYDGTDWTQYHTYGIEWRTDNTVIYYVDGIERWRSPVLPTDTPGLDEISSFSALFPLITTLPMDWMTIQPASAPGLYPPLHGKTMNVDYIRITQKPGWSGAADSDFANPANWGPDGIPDSTTAAVFNSATARTAVTLPAGQTARSLWIDTANAPAFTFNGGPLKLGHTAPGMGGVMMTNQVTASQIVNAPIEAQTNLEFANLSNNASATLTLNGVITAAPSFTGAAATPSVFFNAQRNIVVNAPITAPVSRVHKWGTSGILTLPAGSTFTGDFSIENGHVRFADPTALGGNVSASVAFTPGAKHSEAFRPRLIYTGPAATLAKNLLVSGASADGIIEASGTGPLTWLGNALMAPVETANGNGTTRATLTLGGNNTGNNTFTGNLSDAGAFVSNNGTTQAVTLTLTKANAGNWVLTGSTRASGNVSITGGTLVIGNGTSGTLSTPAVSVSSGATLVVDRSDTVALGSSISGSGSFRKRGSGTLTLSGNQTFSGSANVEAGTLLLTGTLGSGSTLVVNSGATFGGNTTVSRGLTVNGTLLLSSLTVGGSASLSSTGVLLAPFTTNTAPAGPVAATTLSLASGSRVDVQLNAPGSSANFIHSFWRTARSFPLFTSLSRSGTLTLGTVTTDSAGNNASTYGAFSLQHTSTGANLLWTPLPGFPVVDTPAVTLTQPLASIVTLSSSDLALRLATTVGGGPSTTFAWSVLSGPGTATIADTTSSDTTATFSTSGTYVLRATAANALGTATTDLTVHVSPPALLTFRQGENTYSHAATFIRGDTVSWNSGARDQFLIGRNGSQPMRGLLAFDLSSVPSGATAQSAVLETWIPSTGGGTSLGALDLHELLVSFTEGTGNGSSSTNGVGTGADWANRTPSAAWSSPGAAAGTDYAASTLASVSGLTPAAPGGTLVTFPTSPAFAAAANSALTAGLPLGLLVKTSDDTTAANAFIRLCSDDHATLSQRPRLTLSLSYASTPSLATGPPPAATVGVAATLSGSATDATSTLWSLVSGPGPVNFSDAATPATSVTFSASGTYVLRLSASNATGEVSRLLTVSATTLHEQWRLTWFGTTANTGNAADSADPDADGFTNAREYTLGTDPTTVQSATFTNNATGSTLLWSTDANWSPAAAPSGGSAARIGFYTGQTLASGNITLNVDTPAAVAVNQLNFNGARGANATVNVALSGTAFTLTANATTAPVINLAGPSGTFTYRIANPLTLAADTQVNLPNSGTLRLEGPITGPGGLTRTGDWGALQITGDNSYAGPTLIPAIGSGGTGVTGVGIGGSTGTLGTGPITANATLTFNRTGTYTLANSISGTGALIFQGGATYSLTGNTSYTGNTTVWSSTLRLSSSLASPLLTIQSAATLEPRGAPSLAGGLTLAAGSTTRFRLNGPVAGNGYDQLLVAGNVTLNGTLAVVPAGGLSANTTFTLIEKAGASAFAGTFNGLAQNATFSSGGYTFRVNYTGGTGNDLTLQIVSVPLTPIESWRVTHFGTSANTGDAANLADPDLDSLNNLLEFALGTSPVSSSPNPVSIESSPAALSINYPRSVTALSSVTFAPEWTDTLAAQPVIWLTTNVTTETLSDNGTVQQVRSSVPLPSSGPRFLRLRVTTP